MEALRARIRRHGPLPFSVFMEEALYGGNGFYSKGGGAGRHRDFLTSPEVGPLFGAVLARALDAWWDEGGRPDPFVVVETGAGPGTLARSILHATPRCASALQYVLVDRSESMRASHPPPSGAAAADRVDDEAVARPAQGPTVVSIAHIPNHRSHVVLANEMLDNLAFDLAERTASGWTEVRIDETGEVLVPAGPQLNVDRLAPDARVGARIPVQREAAAWVRRARQLAERVVVLDYASTTPELARRPWTEWCRTYRDHRRGGLPLEDPGSQDITCEVASDQLPTPTGNRSQAEFLQAHGIEALVEDGRRYWREHASAPNLKAIEARSRVTESEALLDHHGLGAFRVLEW